MTSRHRKNTHGLTLLEVLLAIAILGVGAAVLLTAAARCMSVVSRARHYSTAQRLIHRVGAENPLSRGMIDTGRASGTFSDEPAYRWERELTESEQEEREGLFTLRTRVSWSDRGQDRYEETVTWIYIPPEEF